MPLPAGKIYSFEEARKAASPYGFVICPSINALGERDPNIGVISVADGKNTEIKFSLVWLSPPIDNLSLNLCNRNVPNPSQSHLSLRRQPLPPPQRNESLTLRHPLSTRPLSFFPARKRERSRSTRTATRSAVRSTTSSTQAR